MHNADNFKEKMIVKGNPNRRRIHLTLSFHADTNDLKKLFGNWTETIVSDLKFKLNEGRDISLAIDSFFDDIADRKRKVTGSSEFIFERSAKAQAQSINVLIPRSSNWLAENIPSQIDLGSQIHLAASVASFWFAHSDLSITYNISLSFDYGDQWSDFFALSIFQKMFFPTENTDWLAAEKTILLPGGELFTIYEYLLQTIEEEIRELGKTLNLTIGNGNKSSAHTLFGFKSKPRHEFLPAGARALIVIEDNKFFDEIQKKRKTPLPNFPELTDFRPSKDQNHPNYVVDFASSIPADQFLCYFLSGFLQNIIDFLEQDPPEVRDGIDPIYPPCDFMDNSFVLYANATTVFQVTKPSRSVERTEPYIGTDPYMLFVHLLAMYREVLANKFEREVHALWNKLPGKGLQQDPRLMSAEEIEDILDEVARYRFKICQEVQLHDYFDILRYDTEKDSFQSILEVRSLAPRREHWNETVKIIEDTVSDIRSRLHRKNEQDFNTLLAWVAGFSVFQTLFAGTQAFRYLTREPTSQVKVYFPYLNSDFSEITDALAIAFTIISSAILLYLLIKIFRPRWLKVKERASVPLQTHSSATYT